MIKHRYKICKRLYALILKTRGTFRNKPRSRNVSRNLQVMSIFTAIFSLKVPEHFGEYLKA